MPTGAITFVYNERVNLPIWVNYYGKLFGEKNLFVVDRGSNDGSTDALGEVNLIKVPRNKFDEHDKTSFMSSFHASLLSFYDTVIITDCDEILVPDPGVYSSLADYIQKNPNDYVNGMGVDVVHVINKEPPLDFTQNILAQRKFGRFHSPECKHLVSRVPIKWLPGLHSSNKPPLFDKDLIVFHLKLMDYGVAMQRQKVNLETIWSEQSLKLNYGAHHRYDYSTFVHESFLVPIDILHRTSNLDFEFGAELDLIKGNTVFDEAGFYRIPMNVSKMVSIPERFSSSF